MSIQKTRVLEYVKPHSDTIRRTVPQVNEVISLNKRYKRFNK